MSSLDILTRKQNFKAVFESLLREDGQIFPIVQRKINKYGLRDTELFEVLSEVYIRGIDTIERGGKIDNPQRWSYKVAHFVICNRVRNQYRDKKHFNFIELDVDKYDSTECKIVSQISNENAECDNEILQEKQLEKLWKAFSGLNSEDQIIFDLRFRRSLSWKEVEKHLADSGIQRNIPTLRKRGERIKERLKQFLLTKD
ncbi:hypothetical protein DSM106972_095180 [Dulcicalothrix desertica PCC 7102]|uniref:Sigma-70 family RNA polymerase sigma factor n=1 Tax=Dulcicalothrix desertica PCC 7102 TaxID=232991 RepID=A0A3S1AK53_9CYAN|nr:sigma-70 family RNA polymerase sigma factor [Dulcicalothrix desertica]RUS93919.1 hypothetical protein DSM106972_095180 [Dulcicalothrix desertica PCC 7102]TWH61607.1 DNA-directed RNA polymerase specialized sigma24 family protein [Dulcicalothrix desertica PCC 7102]